MTIPNLPFLYISDSESLKKWAEITKSSLVMALDTEFMRVNTYHPDLCLVQIATQNEWVIIDPKTIDDLSPLNELLTQKSLLKIVHSGVQDLETIYHHLRVLPQPLFDTQIAYTILNPEHNGGVSYQELVQNYIGVLLDKDQTRTNWALRPLSEAQIDYAIGDVKYLIPIFLRQHEILMQKNFTAHINAAIAGLLKPEKYQINFDEIWRKVKNKNKLKGRKITLLRHLASLREKMAIEYNKPRQWIVSDETLIKLCLFSDKVHILGFTVSTSQPRERKYLEIFIKALQELVPKEITPKETTIQELSQEPL